MFLDGLPEWKKAKKPLYSSVKYLNEMAAFKNSVVLVDIRDAAEVKAAHIEGATALPAEQLGGSQAKFPAKKTAPVIIVANDDAAALQAFNTIREWGYKNASILQGGIQGWQKAGFATVAGDAASDIVYVQKPVPGAMTAEAFQAILAKKDDGTVIVDVRTEEEAQAGAIAGALNIPTDEISDRIGEIPKDKQIITYCSTGIRAEMAYIALKDKGFNATFLNAKTDFAEGKYTISEN